MQLRTFKIFADNLNLKRREDSFKDRVQVGGSTVDGQEFGIMWVQHKREVVTQLLLELLAEQMSRIMLVCDDGIQRTKNLLRRTLVRKCKSYVKDNTFNVG